METQQIDRYKRVALVLGVFIVSFGALSFEISLTRIFSIILDYHYTFLVVSLALFGIGLGGVIAHYLSSKSSAKDNFSKLAILTIAFSLLTTVLTLFTISNPNLGIGIQAFIMFLPFLIAGTLLAMSYKILVNHSGILHFADLGGAALGSLAVVFLINWGGAAAATLSAIAPSLIMSMVFALAAGRKLVIGIALIAIVGMGIFAANSSSYNLWTIQPAIDQGKELTAFLTDPSVGGEIVESRWSSFGQVQLVTSPALPHEKVIFVDGGAGTALYHFDGNFNSTDNKVSELRNSTQFFPYLITDKQSSLVIGPGGGLDVLTALMGDVNHIYAVEVNPSIVDLVQDYSSYDGGIYTNYSNVHVTVDEGRSFLKRSDQRFSTIMLDIPISKTSQGTFGYSLSENYLFTTDSFKDYLNHLSDDGFLAVVAHSPTEVYKLVSIAFQVLIGEGLYFDQVMQRIAVIGSTSHMDHSALPIFLLKKTPITMDQAKYINSMAAEKGLSTLYTPVGTSTDQVLNALGIGQVRIRELIAEAPFNMNPATDDKPFFYNSDLGIPSTLVPLLIGSILLTIVVTVSYAIARRREEYTFKNGTKIRLKSKFSVFKWYIFASLGFGFMLIEIALIQKFILFLGEPTLAIAASLSSLLFAGGLGSLLSRSWIKGRQYNAFRVSLIIAVLTIVYIFMLPFIFNATLSYSASLRFGISFAVISPLGFLMGIPFPTTLGYIKEEFENDAAWMWSINGAFSVLAGVFGIAAAMLYGFNVVLLVGAMTYAALFFVGRKYDLDNRLGKVKWINPQSSKFKRSGQRKVQLTK